MPEATGESLPQKPRSHTIGRRNLIIGGLATASLLALPRDTPRLLEFQKPITKESVQNRFNIIIRTEKEMIDDPTNPVRDDPFWQEPNYPVLTKLDARHLQLLEGAFFNLPRHFYSPSQNGEKLTITFTNEMGSSLRSLPSKDPQYKNEFSTAHRLKTNEITLGKSFNPDTSDHPDSFSTLAHELIHRITPSKDGTAGTSLWHDKVEEIIGIKFKDWNAYLSSTYRPIMEPIRHKVGFLLEIPENKLQQLTPEEQELALFFMRFRYGIAYENFSPDEMLAVLGEHYLHGKNYFTKMYGTFFDKEKTTKLYEFTKNEIFKGKEYTIYPEIKIPKR